MVKSLKVLGLVVCMLAGQIVHGQQNAGVIKVGILHSITGTMAVSEYSLNKLMLMLIEQQNKKGGLLGKKIVPVERDPQSDWDLFAEYAEEMIKKEKVNTIFGCWTSASRKAVLPVVEKYNALLYYPVQYEGQELSKNVFYLGATPNQQAIPAVKFLLDKGFKKFYLIGTDYVYPRTTNNILYNYLLSSGISEQRIQIQYTPFAFADWEPIIDEMKYFAGDDKMAIISTINGDANISFYKTLANNGLDSLRMPVMAFSVGENELKAMDTRPLVGNYVAWNYFMSIEHHSNDDMIELWQNYMNDPFEVFSDPMESAYLGFTFWVRAVEIAGTTEVDQVRKAMSGLSTYGLTGEIINVDDFNQHLHKPVFIGEIMSNGQFRKVYKSEGIIPPRPFSPYYKE